MAKGASLEEGHDVRERVRRWPTATEPAVLLAKKLFTLLVAAEKMRVPLQLLDVVCKRAQRETRPGASETEPLGTGLDPRSSPGFFSGVVVYPRPAYSPSRLCVHRLKSQVSQLTLKTPWIPLGAGGDDGAPHRQLSTITRLVVGSSAGGPPLAKWRRQKCAEWQAFFESVDLSDHKEPADDQYPSQLDAVD